MRDEAWNDEQTKGTVESVPKDHLQLHLEMKFSKLD